MEEILAVVRLLTGLICLLVAVPLLMVGSACCGYFTVLLAGHRRPELPNSWHNAWGLNNANLLFFPSQLDETGLKYHAKAKKWGFRMLLGAAFGIAAFLLYGKL